jgi:hypothetical protein
MFGIATKTIDRNRTGAMNQDEVLTLMGWDLAQYQTAQALGLETMMTVRDRPMAGDPRGEVTVSRKVHVHVLVHWLERMKALGLEPKTIDTLLGR